MYLAVDLKEAGDATVIKPSGSVLAGPLHQEKAILYAQIDVAAARSARKSLDVAGHYGRPDIFRMEVNRNAMPPATFSS